MNTAQTMAPWIGSAVPAPGTFGSGAASPVEPDSPINARKRILILGESWYGTPTPLSVYIASWCTGVMHDHFFSRIFHAATGFPASGAIQPQRSAFWNSVMFDNFVNFPVGLTISHKATSTHFLAAAATFPARLIALAPDAVWVLGKGQAKHSVPLIKSFGCRCVPSPHPRWRVTTAQLRADWLSL